MRIQARLCHIEAERCIVEVSAWQAEEPLGSALGEASTAEAAEDRALERLITRLGSSQSNIKGDWQQEVLPNQVVASFKHSLPEKKVKLKEKQLYRDSGKPENSYVEQLENASEPEDWSDELAEIDLELKRIGWDRKQEKIYLERAFGRTSRHTITQYNDLTAFLKRLKEIVPGERAEQAAGPIRRTDLLKQSDLLLEKLSWTTEQGQSFLQEKLNVNSRQKLTNEELHRFNIYLEEIS